ncbi:GNAT family N-acetyltransferase [Sphaerisporangium album]|uniref:GNAT family N-acetyltransferase n=1 Tax=Sphaerisporangium album TaxID=509200 RepID=A0A367FJP2_9ACTN|nr:GNAT family N-acetyltransferase [Sphaerisporangium album]RCG29850.1 GNAT family N-acetyltransferase [Sphaerisporangium album]
MPVKDDAEAIARACSAPETADFLPALPQPYALDDALAFITELSPGVWDLGGASFVMADAAGGEWLGDIELKPLDARGAGEIGYLVAPWARGRGVATAAVRALTEWAFAQGVHRVSILADVENVVSQRVAMAAGYRREGVLRDAGPRRGGGHVDMVAFARLARDPGEPQRSYLPGLPGGSLSDGVVLLAPLTMDDVDSYQEMASEPDSYIYSVPPQIPDREETVRRCRYTGTWWLAGERAEMSVRDAATGAFAGHIQLMQVAPPIGQAMIGYSLLGRFRGRGFMTRAVNLLAEWAYAATPLHRLVAGTATGNTASQRVLQRAGFTREAVIRSLLPAADGTRHDDIQWVRLRG